MTPETNHPTPINHAESEKMKRLAEFDKCISAPNAPTFRTLADDLSEGSNMAIYLGVQDVAKTVRPDSPEE